jgi:circadian clock protein KaiC
MQYASTAAERGEKVLFVLFEETIHVLLSRAEGLGMSFQRHVQNGRLHLMHIDPAEYSPGQLANVIQTAVREQDFKFICLDSLNGYIAAMPEERFLMLHMHELLTFLNLQGVATFMVLAQHGLLGSMQSPADLTYLADTVILLRYFEAEGEIRQAISVLKKRSGHHERMIREMTIDNRGIHVGEPLTNFQGVLTGVPSIRNDNTRKTTRTTREN